MLKANKATLDFLDNDVLIKIKNDFENSLNNENLNDIQKDELEEMIKYIEEKNKVNYNGTVKKEK